MKNEEILDKNRTFFDRWARTYDRKWNQFWMKKFQQPILALPFSSATTLLDVSCGTGELLLELSKRHELVPHNLMGIDISEQMLVTARAKLPNDISLQLADVHALPFKDDTFDYVISTEAFHHYYDQGKALSELKRVTKTGGELIVIDPNFFLRPIHYLFRILEPGCVKMNSRKEMKILFERAGLKKITQQRIFLFAVMTKGKR